MLETLAIGFLTFVGIAGAINPVVLYVRRRTFANLLNEQVSNIEFEPLRAALAASPNPIPVSRIVFSASVSIAYIVSLWTVLNA